MKKVSHSYTYGCTNIGMNLSEGVYLWKHPDKYYLNILLCPDNIGVNSLEQTYSWNGKHPHVCPMVDKVSFNGISPWISTLSIPLAYTLMSRASKASIFNSGVQFCRFNITRSYNSPIFTVAFVRLSIWSLVFFRSFNLVSSSVWSSFDFIQSVKDFVFRELP